MMPIRDLFALKTPFLFHGRSCNFSLLGFVSTPRLEERSMRKSIAAVAVVAAASMAVVGLAPAASAADGVATAKAIVAKYSKNPTSLGNLPVIGKPIPKGKYVIAMTGDSDAAITLNNFLVQAGKLLGWRMEAVQAKSTIEDQRKVLAQAIAKKPDGIAISGLEPESYGDLFKAADKANIVIMCSACLAAPYAAVKDTHVAGPKMLDLWGQMIAAFAVANVKGTPDVQAFGLSVYPVLVRYDKSFEKNLKKLSPKAKYKFNELDFSPGQIGNAYKANPTTNFMSSDLGDFALGWPQQLFTVGAIPGQKPLIGGLTAGKAAIQALKDKTENAWTAYSLPIVGYSVIDSFARLWTNTPFAKADLPTQILTQKNVGSAVIDAEGNYVGVKDFQAQFKKIWGLK
jgi:ABC-type sugar transport system substrate-binding protein